VGASGRGVEMRGGNEHRLLGSKQNEPVIGEGKEGKTKGFNFLKNIQTNEFKHKFEFKHSKAMHQHVCNIKLL
jgi:hypothetical protein